MIGYPVTCASDPQPQRPVLHAAFELFMDGFKPSTCHVFASHLSHLREDVTMIVLYQRNDTDDIAHIHDECPQVLKSNEGIWTV